jgi:predicted membrane protein
MDKNLLLLIFFLFLVSSQLWNMSWTILMAGSYIIGILLILNNISPDASSSVKDIITRMINLDFSLLTDFLKVVSKIILSFFKGFNYSNINIQKTISNMLPIKEERINDGRKYVEDLFSRS